MSAARLLATNGAVNRADPPNEDEPDDSRESESVSLLRGAQKTRRAMNDNDNDNDDDDDSLSAGLFALEAQNNRTREKREEREREFGLGLAHCGNRASQLLQRIRDAVQHRVLQVAADAGAAHRVDGGVSAVARLRLPGAVVPAVALQPAL
jgi:hypothetical protein